MAVSGSVTMEYDKEYRALVEGLRGAANRRGDRDEDNVVANPVLPADIINGMFF